MKLNKNEVIVKRPYKTVYKDSGRIVKVFSSEHPKASVFNEALNHARIEETHLNTPTVLEVSEIDGNWAIATEYIEGTTMESLMQKEGVEKYMEKFVDLQVEMHNETAPLLNKLKDKLIRKINSVTDIDATTRYELCTRLDSMPKHTKVCHGDFNPSNVIVMPGGSLYIIDWAHATQGNASADAALTYLEFALKNRETADMYLKLFCTKSNIARQYVEKWLPIVAAYQLTKENTKEEKEFLLTWTDVVDFE